jgi:uncharacterized protein
VEKVESVLVNGDVKIKESKVPLFRLLLFFVVIFIVYLIIKNTIGFYFLPVTDNTTSFAILFILGIITSFHCIIMCGGINLSQSLPYAKGGKSKNFRSSLINSLLYNSGRVVSYTLVGALSGGIGSVIMLEGGMLSCFGVFMGIIIILSGLRMLDVPVWLIKYFRIPNFFDKLILKYPISKNEFFVGLLTVFMPCGPIQAIQLFAISTKSITIGAVSMLVFALGTMPVLLSFGALSSFFTKRIGSFLMKANAALVFLLGISLILGSLGLPYAMLFDFTASNTVTVAGECGTGQKVTTELKPGISSPIIIQEGIPLTWTINVESGYLNALNNEIVIPQYKLRQKLHQGENLIEFTPAKSGIITYSTWFGLVGSRIKVVKDVKQVRYEDIEEIGGVRTIMPTGLGCCK